MLRIQTRGFSLRKPAEASGADNRASGPLSGTKQRARAEVPGAAFPRRSGSGWEGGSDSPSQAGRLTGQAGRALIRHQPPVSTWLALSLQKRLTT